MDAATLEPEVSPKRRQIVTAAEALFLAHGYGAVSMDGIARAASVSKATLYAHFASKGALFAAIMADKGADAPIETDVFPETGDDLRTALTITGGHVLRFMLRPRTLDIYRLAIAEASRFPEVGRAFYEGGPLRFCGKMRAWIERQIAAGRLVAPDPEAAAQQFAALLRCGVFMRATLSLPPEPDDAEIEQTVAGAVSTFLKAYAPAAGPAR